MLVKTSHSEMRKLLERMGLRVQMTVVNSRDTWAVYKGEKMTPYARPTDLEKRLLAGEKHPWLEDAWDKMTNNLLLLHIRSMIEIWRPDSEYDV